VCASRDEAFCLDWTVAEGVRPLGIAGLVSSVMVAAAFETLRAQRTRRELDVFVGREVKITVVDRNPSAFFPSERSVQSGEPQRQPATLEVETIEKVADRCASPR